MIIANNFNQTISTKFQSMGTGSVAVAEKWSGRVEERGSSRDVAWQRGSEVEWQRQRRVVADRWSGQVAAAERLHGRVVE